jgi:DNA-binding NtrC family response regulator
MFCKDQAEIGIIKSTLEMMDGNKARTAKLLGITRSQLYEKLKKYSL